MARSSRELADPGHSESYVSRLRKQTWERAGRTKPHGFKMAATCGNRRCIALEHLSLEVWKSYTRRVPTPWSRPVTMNQNEN